MLIELDSIIIDLIKEDIEVEGGDVYTHCLFHAEGLWNHQLPHPKKKQCAIGTGSFAELAVILEKPRAYLCS